MTESEHVLVVGLGASAGGVQAFRTFFEHVPADSGMAFVVVLHLSPEYDSRLTDILQAVSKIPVTTVGDRVHVEPNHVYVISPRQSLAMVDGYLVQSPVTRGEERRAPVDMFFRTLAESHEAHSACLVLSGTGSDGSMGLKRIKERGGICLVEDPAEAEYSDMPRNAIATGLVDGVLPVAEMPARLVAYRDSLAEVRLPEEPEARHAPDERALHEVFAQLRARTGHDFSNYKRATVLRRIARRIGVRQVGDLAGYLEYLREHPEEAQALLKDLLISVTNFFRDTEAFKALEQHVIPKLFDHKREDDQVRVWVPGCATGEEAYSVAMLLSEYASAVPESPSVQIFATDIDEQAIAIAREGVYSAAESADLSAERLRRFFVKEGESFRVRKELREMVLFAHHNLIKDPPFSHLDLVSCRNLLIYLNRTAQHRVMEVIHFALNPSGYLFLGASESIEGTGDLFVTIDKEAHIFQSRGGAVRLGLPVPALGVSDAVERRLAPEPQPDTRVRERLAAPELHQRLLERYAPPSVVVNEEHEIVHMSDRAGRYMQMAGGEPTHNLVKLIRPELRLELRTALYQAAQHRHDVEARGLTLRVDDRTVTVNLLVHPVVRDDDQAKGFFLVLFEEAETDAAVTERDEASLRVAAAEPARQMEEELVRLKSQLRTTVEQYETQAEELKASNEELQAINEELRSATEELETSKEELQSLNEELRTVNQELKVKIEEQTQASNDVQNLINSTDIGTVFLDRTGRIKLFTPRARDIFNLIPSDRGRPLDDINSHLVDVDLQNDVDLVLDRLERVEREVATRAGRWYLMRVGPYRTADDHIDGVVLTFVDITERKRSAERLQHSEERLRRALEVETIGVIFFGADHGITDTNEAFLKMSGYSRDDLRAGRLRWDTLTTREWRPEFERALNDLRTSGRVVPFQLELCRPDDTRWTALFAATALSETEHVAFVNDVTERQRATEALRAADQRKNEFLATLAHELRNPLAPIATGLELLEMSSGVGPIAEQARAVMQRQLAHIVRLVEDLLEVSRITLGKIELHREPIELGTAIRAVIASQTPAIESGHYDLVVDVPDEPLTVEADPIRIGQIFVNLLNNAIKYTPDGGRITVSVVPKGEWAQVAIKDSGIGIPERMLPTVFDMFAQGEDLPPGHVRSGLGVGLTLVRTLVEGHGGHVQAFSGGPGKGSEFVVSLPLAPHVAAAAPVEPVAVDLSGYAVLVVDDNHDAANSLGMLLTLLGAQVDVAYTGSQALASVGRHAPRLVFLDIGMPNMDGYEVAKRIRSLKLDEQPVLVALTGWGQEHNRQAAYDAGFDHHLTKPADARRLRELLASIMKKS
jgi:two-component system CheB/CheR fusion protein